jgi:nucleotide-binding universal stress UspA family protein
LRVIVGVDGSPQSAHALSWACRRGETCGDTVRAVCAWSLGASGEDWMSQPGVSAEGQRRAEQMLRETVEGAVQEMKVWPFGVALRGEASNRLMLRWLKTVVVSDEEKAHVMRQVGTGKASAKRTADDVSKRRR